VTRQRLSLRIEPPFELAVVAFSHGWVDLAPNRWDAARAALHTAAAVEDVPVQLELCQVRDRLRVTVSASRRVAPRGIRAVVQRMLRLDEDLRAFWALCERDSNLAWVSRRGGGRLLRAPTAFEDLAKLLLTTNCSWSATRRMVEALVQQLGAPTPCGTRTFPSAKRCADMSEGFYRDVIRVGYRAAPLRELAQRIARGALTPLDTSASEPELREILRSLPGFGPYACGQALRLLGHYEDLALDSWCRAKLAERSRSGRVPCDRTIVRRYARFGRYRGLALWLDLTRHWHDSDPATAPLVATPQ
jgi:3-methyladenine DNA glycosylase/8-oxoguanine DNA glycosylase